MTKGAQALIGVARSTATAPISGDEASQLAANAINRRQAERTVAELLAGLRRDAQLEYRDEFKPEGGEGDATRVELEPSKRSDDETSGAGPAQTPDGS